MSKTFLSILAVPNKTDFCTIPTFNLIPSVSNHPLKPLLMHPELLQPLVQPQSFSATKTFLALSSNSDIFPLPVSSNRLTVIIKRLTSKETFHNNLIHALRPLCSDSSRMNTRFLLSNQGPPAGRRTFLYRSSPIYTVIFRILIWYFTQKRYSEFYVTQPPVFLSRRHL